MYLLVLSMDHLTFAKYNSSSVLFLFAAPPRKTNIRHTSDTIVTAKGVKMHATLPALTMVAVGRG